MRTVSLVPSLTEFLFDLGLDQEVVGITKFCIHPYSWFRDKPRVGGTKTPKVAEIKALQPDYVICNKEENRKEDVEVLKTFTNVIVTDINSLADMDGELKKLATIFGKDQKAQELLTHIKTTFPSEILGINKRVAYLIWNKPLMAVGGNTFINDVLANLGLNNAVASDLNLNRYPELGIDVLKELNLDLLMLSSEPYPFSAKHLIHFQQQLPNTKLIKVDGELFSWYGSRMQFLSSHWRALNN